jgi:hypothetical protein
MTAGLNIHVRFWRMTTPVDDEIGGALPTGTIIYDDISARIEPVRPDYILIQQGIETTNLYTCVCRPPNLAIKEYDEVEVVFPLNHNLINKRMLVRNIQDTSIHPSDSRGYLILTLQRKFDAHALV